MKAFFINFWNVMMYSSFILSGFSLLSFPFIELGKINNIYPNNEYYNNPYNYDLYTDNLINDFWSISKNVLNFMFEKIGINFDISIFQLVIAVFVLSLISGFVSRYILNNIEYSNY